MSVKLAVQAISASTAAGIKTVFELGLFLDNIKDFALPTAECFGKLNNLFDCCNSEFKNSKNPYNCALQKNNIRERIIYKKRNLSVSEFNKIMGRIISLGLIFSSDFANCEQNISEILRIDWEAVVNPVMDKENTEKSSNHILENTDKEKMDVGYEEENTEVENAEENADSVEPPISDNATMYFAGYVLHLIFKRQGFEKCMSDIISFNNDLTDTSQILLHHKNYSKNSDFGSLTAPSNQFFTV